MSLISPNELLSSERMASQISTPMFPTQLRFRSGPFLINPATGEITREDIPLKLRPQGFLLLCVLMDRAGELVTREELKKQLWGDQTFVDFDQGLNFCIREIRKNLGDDAGEPKYLQTLPRRGYRFVAPVEKFEVATRPELVTPIRVPDRKPISEKLDVPTEAAAAPAKRTGWPFAIAAVLILLVAGAVSWWVANRSAGSHYPRRIVVLPFDNLTGDPSQSYLVRGVVEEITAQLGAIEPVSIAVIGRTTAEAVASHNYTIGEIGDRLHVDYVVEGSVRREGPKLRITAQLIRVNDMAHVWAESYDREAIQLFTVEQQVASNVVREINLALGRDAKPSTPRRESENPEAMDAYLRGRDSMRSFLSTISGTGYDAAYRTSYENAEQQLRRAIQVDPSFALGYAHLANLQAARLGDEFTPNPDWDNAEQNANRALQLDPNLPEAYVVLGRIALLRSGDLTTAHRSLTRAYELNPNDPATLSALVLFHTIDGNTSEGVTIAERLARLDPMDLSSQQSLGNAFYFDRQYARSSEVENAILKQNPNSFTARMILLHSQYLRGMERAWMETYVHILELAARVSPSDANAKNVLEARKAYDRGNFAFLDYIKGPGKKPFLEEGDRNVAFRYLMLGDKESALKELNRLADDQRYLRSLRTVVHDPMLTALEGDPRLESFLEKIRAR